jgi:hypothetical protein
MTTQRPTGVTILAVLQLIGGILSFLSRYVFGQFAQRLYLLLNRIIEEDIGPNILI